MNEVSIIINGVRYDVVEGTGSSCPQCDLSEVCYAYHICRAFSLTHKHFFKKSDKKFER